MNKNFECTKTTFQEIIDNYHKDHDLELGTNRFALQIVIDANKQAKFWYITKISPHITNDIILAPHNHYSSYRIPKNLISHLSWKKKLVPKRFRSYLRQSSNFIPKTGLIVKEVAERMEKLSPLIAKKHNDFLK